MAGDSPDPRFDVHVAVREVSKRFGNVHALNDVSVDFRRGRVHALVGENGAGKSTLGKIVAGLYTCSDGVIEIDGREASLGEPRKALAAGISMMQQEVSLAPQMTVLENVFMGEQGPLPLPRNQKARRARYEEIAPEIGMEIDPDRRVETLRIPEQQQVELMRAMARSSRLVVLDEPTASLSRPETLSLLNTVKRLRGRGVTIVFVSHALDDVLAVADDITVMRNGEVIRTAPAESETRESLIEGMLGGAGKTLFAEKTRPQEDAPVVLRASGLSREGVFSDIDLEVRAGEIVGIAGIVGSGRTEVMRAIAGADRLASGTVEVDGEQVRLRSPRDASRAGIALLPESRKDEGLLLNRSIRENVSLANLTSVKRAGVVQSRREKSLAAEAIERFDIRPASQGLDVGLLSGGNQQKVMFAKWLMRTPRVFIADEPTRGVDVGAKATIYELLRSLVEQGLGLLMVSSEIEEVIGLSHRVLVMRDGRIVEELTGDAISEKAILTAALGGGPDDQRGQR